MAEYEADFGADEDFAVQDREDQDRTGMVPGRLYLAMPDMRALQELLSLWERWQRGEPMVRGFAPFANLFAHLRALRPWGPEDRIPEETVAYWREETERHPGQPVRTEVELWFRDSEAQRNTASRNLAAVVVTAGGRVVHEAVIPDIAYHGALVDMPAGEVRNLMEQRYVNLARADDIMFMRPQSALAGPIEVQPAADASLGNGVGAATGDSVAALLDGVPVQQHALLANRLVLDDPDNLQSRTIVSRRVHGTAMASLIVHGDRNEGGPALPRPLYVRPLLIADGNGQESTDSDRLVIDTVYRSVLRMKGSEGEEAAAPRVFLVNISVGDRRRPFAQRMSPLARLLDFLSNRYNILFLVSGGNVPLPLEVPDFNDWARLRLPMSENGRW
jgi:hypothetical protein